MKSPETIALEDDIPELKPLHETKRQLLLGKLKDIHVELAKGRRDELLVDKVRAGGTLVKSNKLFGLGDMVSILPASDGGKKRIFSIEQTIEELTQVFTDKWCRDFDDGTDFRKCEDFFETGQHADDSVSSRGRHCHACKGEEAESP